MIIKLWQALALVAEAGHVEDQQINVEKSRVPTSLMTFKGSVPPPKVL